ncbi:hypothetical protein QUA20_02835 [Microcoleus sp. Pol7_A1]|uniref:hypothetical protein n=1 Tax=Microcoleus sp. Pol7_A1 TaxID=2818893 RepID=UPI002FD69513
METYLSLALADDPGKKSPHSLGKLIEWKLLADRLAPLIMTPHSLGKLIEWKRT